MNQQEIFEWAEGKSRIRLNQDMQKNVKEAFFFIYETYGEKAKNPIYIAAIKNKWKCYDDLPECQSDLCNKKKGLTKEGKEFSKSCGCSKCANRIVFLNGGNCIDYQSSSRKRAHKMKNERDQRSLCDSRYKDYSFEEIQSIVSKRTPLYFRNKESYELLVKIEELTSFLPVDTTTHQRLNCIREGIKTNPFCPVCDTEITCHPQNGFSDTCSQVCASIKTNQTIKERDGVYAIQRAEVKDKAITGLRNYAADKDKVVQSTEKKKRRQKEKNRRTHCNQNHLTQSAYALLSDKEKLKELYNVNGAYWIEHVYDIPNQTIYRYLQWYDIDRVNGNRSASERLVEDFINSLGVETKSGDRSVLDGKEIDIYIPSKRIGIEFDGLYWHSTKVLDHHTASKLHIEKTRKAKQKGVHLIHIFEDEWKNNENIVKSKLERMLCPLTEKVYARKTTVCNVSSGEATRFMDTYHIQGGSVKAKVRLGLRDKDGCLVALMYFKRVGDTWDLCRYATSCSVVGGFTKLLKHFERQYNPKEVVSFADLRWSQGDLYYKCGFELDRILSPSYYYVDNHQRLRKEKFRHARMKTMENFDYNPDETEKENTERNGYYRIYDCGLMRFKKIYQATLDKDCVVCIMTDSQHRSIQNERKSRHG